MIDLEDFKKVASNRLKGDYGKKLYEAGVAKYQNCNHGDMAEWVKIFDKIKELNILLESSSTTACENRASASNE